MKSLEPPINSEGGEANNQSGEKRRPRRPKTSAKGNNNSKNPNTNNPPNNPSSNNNGNNDNPTIIYSSTAKSSKCSVHELSKYCNAEDELAIRERAEEIILKFVHAPQNAPALMDEFLGRFTRPQSYLNGFEETEYQTKSRTEDYIMFCINYNRFGLTQSHIERYNAGEKQVILTPEQTQVNKQLDVKHFSQTKPAVTIHVPARGEDTVVQSQAPLFKIEEVAKGPPGEGAPLDFFNLSFTIFHLSIYLLGGPYITTSNNPKATTKNQLIFFSFLKSQFFEVSQNSHKIQLQVIYYFLTFQAIFHTIIHFIFNSQLHFSISYIVSLLIISQINITRVYCIIT
ncbi:Hypothetical_protein [Hexamita inflata]|uniref:Hypothetical_protein n=1 Tax=Hexamita inflata TaxID=28002 RepID=A0ABP1GXV5_9EUKA